MNRSLVPAVTLVLAAALAGCDGPGASSGATESVAAPSLDATSTTGTDAPVTAQSTSRASTTALTPGGTRTVTHTVTAVPGTSTTSATSPSTPTPTRRGPWTTTTAQNAEFWSPSGSVHCGLSGDFAACEVAHQTFSAPAKPSTCDFEYPGDMIEMMGAHPAEFRCGSDEPLAGFHDHQWWTDADGHPQRVPGAPALGYGHTLTTGTVSCRVDRTTGVTCARLDGSHGFTLSRNAYRTW